MQRLTPEQAGHLTLNGNHDREVQEWLNSASLEELEAYIRAESFNDRLITTAGLLREKMYAERAQNPHWTLIPLFWISVLALTAGVLSLLLSWGVLRPFHLAPPSAAVDPGSQSTAIAVPDRARPELPPPDLAPSPATERSSAKSAPSGSLPDSSSSAVSPSSPAGSTR